MYLLYISAVPHPLRKGQEERQTVSSPPSQTPTMAEDCERTISISHVVLEWRVWHPYASSFLDGGSEMQNYSPLKPLSSLAI